MKLELLEVVLEIRSHYTDLIVRSAPKTEEEVAEVRRVVQLRDQLTVAANQIIEGRFTASVNGLEHAHAELTKLNRDLESVVSKLLNMKAAIDLGVKVISVVARIVSLAGRFTVRKP